MSNVSTVSGVIPCYIFDYSDALNVRTRQTVAFQGKCRCGWQGKWQAARQTAMRDYQAHKPDCKGWSQ